MRFVYYVLEILQTVLVMIACLVDAFKCAKFVSRVGLLFCPLIAQSVTDCGVFVLCPVNESPLRGGEPKQLPDICIYKVLIASLL